MRVLFTTILLLLLNTIAWAQQPATISLTDVKVAYKPANFHLAHVVDKRENPNQLGNIKDGIIDLQGGVAAALKSYLDRNIAQDKSTIPITLQLNRFDITEKQVGRKRQFDLNVGIAYYSGSTKLIEYNGSSFTQSLTDAAPYIEKMIRENIANNLVEFDNWLAKNKESVTATPTVEVSVALINTTDKSERIPYTPSRKLSISDFKGTPDDSSPGAAATMSGVWMDIEASKLYNHSKVKVTLSVYFDKDRSWMKPHGKNTQVLAHEQRHFDITAIKACELKQLIEQTTFSPDGYREELRALLRKNEDEGTAMQNTYDQETEHSTITEQQQAWNEKIASMLTQQNCY